MTDRSYLFVPGDRPERFDKALASGAHAVILDLEDAVLPASKVQARNAIAQWLNSAASGIYIRINATETPWHNEDCELLQHPKVRGVMLPKAESADAIEQLRHHLTAQQHCIPLIETVQGWYAAAAIARAAQVLRLAFGSVDFMMDSGIQGDAAELDSVRSHLVLTSRHANLQAPIDGVSLAIDDADRLLLDTGRSRRWGFGAKLCIHPKQVPNVNLAFAPSAQEIDWAQRVHSAVGNAPLGAIVVDGKLVDAPIVRQAAAILAASRSPASV